MIFNSGDRVCITYDGNTMDAEIFLACSIGLSLTVTFNGRLGNYTGLMPLLWVDDHYIDLIHARPVTISRIGRVIPWPASPTCAINK